MLGRHFVDINNYVYHIQIQGVRRGECIWNTRFKARNTRWTMGGVFKWNSYVNLNSGQGF